MRRRTITNAAALTAIVGLVLGVTVAPAMAASWKIDSPTPTSMTGVSPHVEKTARGDLVFRSDGPAGTTVAL